LRIAVFVQRTDDIITNPYESTFSPDGLFPGGIPEFRGIAGNVGHSTAAGTEIGLRGHAPSGFRWNASYSFISIADNTTLNHLYSPQNFAQGTPTHVVVLGGGYTYGPWEFDVQSRWQSWYLDYRSSIGSVVLVPIVVGNYLTADARIGYRLTDNVTVALSAQQFNVSHLTVTAGPPVERRVFVTVVLHL
jgi:outer membrane receptor protein involved in Fe transport